MSDPQVMLMLGGFMGLVFGSALTGFLFAMERTPTA